MKEILIRNATNSDSALISDFIFDIWQHEYHFSVHKKDFPDLSEIEDHYPPGSGFFLVAFDGNTLVGTIASNKLRKDQWVLKRMFVKKSHRREGIAQSLLNNLLGELLMLAPDNRISLFLSTKENEATSAKAFYLKNGFKIIEKSTLPDNFPYFHEDDLFMVKQI